MKIFICDDEPQILPDLVKKVSQYLPDDQIRSFSSGKALLEEMNRSVCDILLLDIDMPEINGMDAAKAIGTLQVQPLLIFVTSHDELVYDSFQYHPFGFIRKSFFDREIEKVLLDCQKELESRDRHFCFRSEGKEISLFLSDIYYFEAHGNYLQVCSSKGTYRFRSTVAAVENSLAHRGFIRIHKGFLVNQAAVQVLGIEEARLIDGTSIPIGKSYAQTAREQLMKYMRS